MRSIKPLPEAVRSSVRSGTILYDLTRVVEELVFNSLDAGATKVYVAVGVGTCFAKVADNGSGVDRDGLVLLGKRYVSSRYDQSAGLDTSGSFGFHGEALCSIADVSLIEIITKAQGMPHGYRKVMKGHKCLYLGIDDEIRDVGTTVVVRDLFYNQPVRRKHMQSSPKKILYSVKKCVLRIALVHSRVSFRVADIESEDELLRTGSSPSPLLLLSSSFGIEASSSLNELKACEGELKLSGYISGPLGIPSPKAFQYIYINSRFVCKGPIHKLLNQLSAGYWDNRKVDIGPENEKGSRSKMCPTFMLNLICPRRLYDLSFEPSKNSVEFRDWGPILFFFQNAVTCIWTESISDDLQVNPKNRKKRRRTQKWLASLEVPSSEHQKLTEDCDHLPAWRECLPSWQKSNGDTSELEKHHREGLFIHDTDNAVQSCYTSPFHCKVTKNEKSQSHTRSSQNPLSAEDNFWGKGYNAANISNEQVDSFLGSKWLDESFEKGEKMSIMSTGWALSSDCHEFCDEADVSQDFEKPSQLSCSTPRSLPHCRPPFSSEVGFEFESSDITIQQKWVDIGEEDGVDRTFKESLSRQDEVKSVWSVSRCSNLYGIRANSNFSSRDIRSPLIAGECLDEEKYLLPDSVKYDNFSYNQHLSTPESEWTPLASSPLFDTKFPDADNFIGENFPESHSAYDKGTRYTYFPDEQDREFTVDMRVDNWGHENCSISSCVDFSFDKFNAAVWGDDGKFRGHKRKGPLFPNYSEVFADERDWWHLNSCDKISHPHFSDPLYHFSLSAQSDRNQWREIELRNQTARPHIKRARRSQSAPPFYKHRKKYVTLNNSLAMANSETNFLTINSDFPVPETSNMNCQQQLFSPCHISSMPNYVNHTFSVARSETKRTPESFEIQNRQLQSQGQCINSCTLDPVKDFVSKEIEDILESGQKWHGCCPETLCGVKSHNIEDQNTVLDISSGILHLAGDSLVPSSIEKNSLEDARVLQQVDKKFIPVIAGRTLAIIDQHAADERIRLEELRQKVLSGEMKEITHLESEQELVLPEIGYQLLHNYAEQIQNWGWICHINGQGSRSFRKNLNVLHRQPTSTKLIAVPCILGVNLTDVDLLEFLQQLADTDGSSTIPPSVHRILNNKACRGAIMFGDTLLPSECSLVVEELKRTSLCFQCAHGRPTTVPLVNLEALHKQINNLGLRSSGTDELWHGLRRHEISLERTARRLNSAIDQHKD